jgi:hypothetical protein
MDQGQARPEKVAEKVNQGGWTGFTVKGTNGKPAH